MTVSRSRAHSVGGRRRLFVLEFFRERKAYVTNIETKECRIYDIPANRGWYSHAVDSKAAFRKFPAPSAESVWSTPSCNTMLLLYHCQRAMRFWAVVPTRSRSPSGLTRTMFVTA